jgi:hypothetical protein
MTDYESLMFAIPSALAVLTVWFLRAEARRLATELLGTPGRVAFTLGLPMSFTTMLSFATRTRQIAYVQPTMQRHQS